MLLKEYIRKICNTEYYIEYGGWIVVATKYRVFKKTGHERWLFELGKTESDDMPIVDDLLVRKPDEFDSEVREKLVSIIAIAIVQGTYDS